MPDHKETYRPGRIMNTVRTRRLTWLLSILALLLMVRLAMTVIPAWSRFRPQHYSKAPAEAVERFRDARFGLFIHWGPVSLIGTEIGWSRGGPRPRLGWTGQIPPEVYDQLPSQFNPTDFDARAWVALARNAGMRYLVFVAKHHDGFCMYDTRFTDHKITRTPFARDVAAELAAACREAGMMFGLYYSLTDWHHPDYLAADRPAWLDLITGQIGELCARYGPLDVLWFDSASDDAYDWPPFDAHDLYNRIRRDQPRVLINDRLGPGDFHVYECDVGPYMADRPWEACFTLGTQWSYKPLDELMSARRCLQLLVACAGRGGNLLLNVGPTPTGAIEPRQADILEEVGQWLQRAGSSIYGTRPGPIEPARWGVCTHAGNTLYIHVLDWAAAPVTLPIDPQRVTAANVLTGGNARIKSAPKGLEIHVDLPGRDPADTVVLLQLLEPLSSAATAPTSEQP